MVQDVDSEEEWSEAELFDAPIAVLNKRRLESGSDSRGEAPGVSPASDGAAASLSRSLKLRAGEAEGIVPSYLEEGEPEISRYARELLTG